MNYGEEPALNSGVTVSADTSFSEVVDEACDKLFDQQVQYSIRLINEMELRLNTLEEELEELIAVKRRK